MAMARVPNRKSVKQGPPRRTSARSADTGRVQGPRKTKAGNAAAGTAKGASTATPSRAVSKDELRAQVEKLERANATLRAKTREATRAAKLAAARIAELQDEVARLQTPRAAQTASRAATMPDDGSPDIDPGDAVPPGVAPQDPEPPDQDAETARENLEAHLRDE
jgi:hypothetical protein